MRHLLAVLLLLLAALQALASASTLHLTPTTTTSTARLYIVNPTSIRREYQTQDSKGFYSYGYSDDSAAKAEYKARDGSSRGFYSYVDSNGKLQTVSYEAGTKQGFKASATNLPKMPVDNRKAPLPVKDTPEVALARQEHLQAIREAEVREALAENERALEAQQRLILSAQAQRERETESREASAEDQEAASLLARARAELAAVLTAQSGERQSDDERDIAEVKNRDQDERTAAEVAERLRLTDRREEQQQQRNNKVNEQENLSMTTYTLTNLNNGNTEDVLGELRTIYTLNDDASNSYLKLGNVAERKSLQTLLSSRVSTAADTQASGELRVPVNSYYTVLTPHSKYSVTMPTVLTALPRLDSIQLNNRLPLSLSSSLLTQRLSGVRV